MTLHDSPENVNRTSQTIVPDYEMADKPNQSQHDM